MVDKILFIEGEPNSPNGNIRVGFAKLLGQKLDKKPKIILGGGKQSTLDKFLNNRLGGKQYVMVDLDKPEQKREEDIKEYALMAYKENVFYMIQEMESWFLSQPEVLDRYYGVTVKGKKISEGLTKKKPSEITDPKEELKKVTQSLNKGEKYHEVSHAVELLERLDATKLENDFPDFKRLIEKLK
jgi:hypothetical protein